MSLKHHIFKAWFWKKRGAAPSKPPHEHEEETVAVPEVHTGKVRHMDRGETTEQEKPIHYDNVAIPEIHIHHKK